jgi:hypothetical protein
MQRPRLALGVLVAATLCLPLVVGQPAPGTYLTRCNTGSTPAYTSNALDSASLLVCCMWTFPGSAGSAGALGRTGTCPNSGGGTIDLSNKKINSIPNTAFATCGSPT